MAPPLRRRATYRLQFRSEFGFSDARALVPYLERLGASDLYSSPLVAPRSGSTHGYDVCDPTRLNPALGRPASFASLSRALGRRGMGLLLDIVPNHMAASVENPWWRDLLEMGRASKYADTFDVDWDHPDEDLRGRVLLPILGDRRRRIVERGELRLGLDPAGFFIRYHEHRLPLGVASYARILAMAADQIEAEGREGSMRHGAGARAASNVPARSASGASPPSRARAHAARVVRALQAGAVSFGRRDPGGEGRRTALALLKKNLWTMYRRRRAIRHALDGVLRRYEADPNRPAAIARLERLLAEQPYRLSFWKRAGEKINYRRFFNISDLVSLRIEAPDVFEARHRLLLDLVAQGRLTGLRIDHVDGLLDPEGYLERLRSRVGDGFTLVVEKILVGGETLPADWPVEGTTGYDFIALLGELWIDPAGVAKLDAAYSAAVGGRASVADIAYEKKRWIIGRHFPGEIQGLGRRLARIRTGREPSRGPGREDLLRGLVEVTACMPVYRTYVRTTRASRRDRAVILEAIAEARRRRPDIGRAAFARIRRLLLLEGARSLPASRRREWVEFVMRWQQITGPVMAKGFEDTTLYVFNRLISLNEVGAEPGSAGISVEEFHDRMRARSRAWPTTMNATATHDTKRGEDARARIAVLSELPIQWRKHLASWRRWNAPHRRLVGGRRVPDASEEIFFYQTLLGAWPLERGELAGFRERLLAYMVKAAREAKRHTSWLDPDPAYEAALLDFARSVLSGPPRGPFMKGFLAFQELVARCGSITSLAQVLLKVAAPGIADFYQGTELWDLSFVDPDNRRPVDFRKRRLMLSDQQKRAGKDPARLARALLSRWRNGGIKMYVTWRSLALRRRRASLFLEGEYLPAYARGVWRESVVAFARRRGAEWVLAAAPRLVAQRAARAGGPPLGEEFWGPGALDLPRRAPVLWENVLTGEPLAASGRGGTRTLPLAELFATLPVALLEARG